jgi:hypothetical protein
MYVSHKSESFKSGLIYVSLRLNDVNNTNMAAGQATLVEALFNMGPLHCFGATLSLEKQNENDGLG